MPLEQETRDELAESLYHAHKSGDPIDRLSTTYDFTIKDAYDIQSRLVDRRVADGNAIVGHKIGLTSKGIQEQLGVDTPDLGRLLNDMEVDGTSIPADELIQPRIEPEIGFRMGEALHPPVTGLDVLAATDHVMPVLEVIDSRIRDWDIGIEDTIADNASSALFLTGNRTRDISGTDLSLEGVKLYHNGELAASGVGAAVMEHPIRSVAWLANTLADLGHGLDAGDLVLSGSLTPAVDIAAGDVVTMNFSSIGLLTVRVGD